MIQFLYELFVIDNIDFIFVYKLLLISFLGFTFHISLSFMKFEWVQSTNQLLNFLLLAPIGFTITSSISSNIALSLGMVGALSIIRFRTPVKNPFELVVYFLLLTIGITSSVDIMLSVILSGFIQLVLLGVYILEKLNLVNHFFDTKYSKDNSNFLTVVSKDEIYIKNLQIISLDFEDSLYTYVLAGNKDEILAIQKDLIKNSSENIEKISSTFYS